MKWIIGLTVCIVAALIWFRPQKMGNETLTQLTNPPPINVRRSPSAPSFPPVSTGSAFGGAAMPEGIAGKLDRLYSHYESSPNPGYTNILETLRPISIEDPAASDLLKDACTFVGMKTAIVKEIHSEEADIRKRREWLIRVNSTPEAQARAVKRFDESPKADLDSLLQAEQALQRIFGERFSQRYGLDRDLVMQELSALTLDDTGPELWIRCDETASPYLEPRKATAPGPHELILPPRN